MAEKDAISHRGKALRAVAPIVAAAARLTWSEAARWARER